MTQELTLKLRLEIPKVEEVVACAGTLDYRKCFLLLVTNIITLSSSHSCFSLVDFYWITFLRCSIFYVIHAIHGKDFIKI